MRWSGDEVPLPSLRRATTILPHTHLRRGGKASVPCPSNFSSIGHHPHNWDTSIGSPPRAHRHASIDISTEVVFDERGMSRPPYSAPFAENPLRGDLLRSVIKELGIYYESARIRVRGHLPKAPPNPKFPNPNLSSLFRAEERSESLRLSVRTQK